MSGHYHYLSAGTVRLRTVISKIYKIIGGILTAIFAFGVIGGLIRYTDALRQYLPVYIVFLIPSVYLLSRGFLIQKQINAARQYETVFSADRDGLVTVREIAELTGKQEADVMKELNKLFQNKYFHDCSLQHNGTAGVILPDAAKGDQGAGFVTVRCDNCGASTRLRAGSIGRCQYCGAPIKGEE